jgi:hypothetical protein
MLVSKLLGETALRFVVSDSDLDCLAGEDASGYDSIIVFAELEWGSHALSSFFGIEVAVTLRLRLKMLAPMCVLSFMPKTYFAELEEVKYNILKARGTRFLQLPFEPQDLLSGFESVMPLSQATLAYLSNLLVDVKHLIDIFRHDLRMNTEQDKIRRSLKRIDMLSSTAVYQKAKELAETIVEAHAAGDEERFYKQTRELVNRLGLYAQEMKHAPKYEVNARRKIVVVDDNLDDLHWATSALENYFEVVPFQQAISAKQYIDEDSGNEIAAVISDWQLLRPGTDEHQEMLGFELLQYAAQRGHYALFSLTSTDDSSTREVDQYLDFEHTLIIKDFHHDEALWKMYIPIIQQKIDRNMALIASLPTGEAWTNSFKLDYRKESGQKVAYKKYFKSFAQQYVEHRNATGWHSFESEISTNATQLWQYYEKAFDPDNCSELFDLKTQWGIELNRELRNMLVVRRLFLAFWFNKTKLDLGFKVPNRGWVEDPVINIYSVLRRRYFNELSDERGGIDDEKTFKDLNNAAKVFANQLAIEPNRLPQGVLPEETAWLQSLDINLEMGNDNMYYADL